MSALGQLRKKVRYETDVPRCQTCSAYKKPVIVLKRDSIPIISRAWCKDANFEVRPMACCDNWRRKGEVLAA